MCIRDRNMPWVVEAPLGPPDAYIYGASRSCIVVMTAMMSWIKIIKEMLGRII